jgi:hypothetical protein
VGDGPGPGSGCCGGDGFGLALGGQKGCGSKHGSCGSWKGGGVVVVGTVVVGVGGTVVVGVGVNVAVGGGSCTLLRGTHV